mgnify:CR=1 FL=1
MPWTEITRPQYRRARLRYASDLTDAEWSLLAPFMPGHARRSANDPSHAGDALQQQTETTMTDRTARTARNQENSLAAFLAKKAEFDALLAELTQASEDHFGADPDTVLWGEAAWLSDATAKLKDIADQHFRRGEYAA